MEKGIRYSSMKLGGVGALSFNQLWNLRLQELEPQDTSKKMEKNTFRRWLGFVDWFVLASLIGIIYGTIPFGPAIIKYIYSIIGKDIFASTVLIALVVGSISVLVYEARFFRSITIGYIARIALVVAILGYIGWLITIPAERVHFFEYAILGIAIDRFLQRYVQNVSRPIIAILIIYLIGMGDETIQCILPNRNGEILDVFLNGWGGVLGVLLVPWPQQGMTPGSHGVIFIIIALTIVTSTLFTLGTREFGYMIVEKHKGFRFRSRLSQKNLLDYDFKNGDYLGEVLKQYISLPYHQFLKRYSANKYPFLHEMRVHIFRRDRYAANRRAQSSWIASRENQILESYFRNTLFLAKLNWPETKSREIQERSGEWINSLYTSPVSSKIITAFPISQFLLMCGGILFLNWGLFFITRRWLHADSKNYL